MTDIEPTELHSFVSFLVPVDYFLVSCLFYEIFHTYEKGLKNDIIENKYNI